MFRGCLIRSFLARFVTARYTLLPFLITAQFTLGLYHRGLKSLPSMLRVERAINR